MRTYTLAKELCLTHCDDLHGKEVQEGGNVCIWMADSLAVQ